MKKISEMLIEQHAIISSKDAVMIKLLEEVSRKYKEAEEPVGEAVKFLDEFLELLDAHRETEELLIFPILGEHDSLVMELLNDHKILRSIVKELREEKRWAEKVKKMEALLARLREHMAKENNELLPKLEEKVKVMDERELEGIIKKLEERIKAGKF